MAVIRLAPVQYCLHIGIITNPGCEYLLGTWYLEMMITWRIAAKT